MRPDALTPIDAETIFAERARGIPVAKIAKSRSKSPGTIYKVLRNELAAGSTPIIRQQMRDFSKRVRPGGLRDPRQQVIYMLQQPLSYETIGGAAILLIEALVAEEEARRVPGSYTMPAAPEPYVG